jgi:hypothetical protein
MPLGKNSKRIIAVVIGLVLVMAIVSVVTVFVLMDQVSTNR